MKRQSYLEAGRRKMFGRPVKKQIGPVEPAPDPATVADFDLGTWRVRPALGRMTRADRIVALDRNTLATLLCLVAAPATGVNRDELAARVFGPGEHEPKLKRALGFLRRIFSEDGSVRLENAPGDAFLLVTGAPVPGRGLRGSDGVLKAETPDGIEQWVGRKRRRWTRLLAAGAVVAAIGMSLLWALDHGNSVTLGSVTGTVVLARAPGPERSPSFAPDARQFVYSWKPDGQPFAKLYVRAVGGASPRPVTTGLRDDLFPAWSPSGNLIAFERIDGPECEVWVARPDGSDEAKVADCASDVAGRLQWTADGNAITYAYHTAPQNPSQLVSVTVADRRMTGVTNPASGQPGDSWPTLAPTGRRLVFQRSRSVGVADLVLIDASTGEPERLTRDGLETYGATFEPGNRTIVFASPRGGRSELWRMTLDGRAPQRLVASRAGELRSPALSNDGRSLAYERWRQEARLTQVAVAGAADEAVPGPFGTGGPGIDRDAQLSPDGRHVAFVSDRGGRDEVWLADADGGNARRLAALDVDYVQSPRWSQDARRLVVACAREGVFGLWTIDVASGRAERLSTDGQAQAPSFSRDGQWLYYASNRTGRWEIWRRGWPDGGDTQLTTEGGFAAQEARDGSALYYVRPDRNGLWKRPREPGGDDVLVTPQLYANDWDNWCVTADAIWFVARPDKETAQLARYSLADETVARVRPLPKLLPHSGLTPTADGRGIVFAQLAKTEVDLEMAKLE